MTRFRRIAALLSGIAMLAVAAALIFIRESLAIRLILALIGIGMTLRGIRVLYFYLTMARSMVGGRYTLYWGILYLDLGILSGSLSGHPAVYAIIYVAALNGFHGVVSMLRARESRASGAHWRFKMAYGAIQVLLAVAVIVCGVVYRNITVAIYVYAAGLVYYGVFNIVSAFRRTSIVYIQ